MLMSWRASLQSARRGTTDTKRRDFIMNLTKEGRDKHSNGGGQVAGLAAPESLSAASAVGFPGSHAQHDPAAKNPTASVGNSNAQAMSSSAGRGALVDGVFMRNQQGQTLTKSTVQWA